YRASGALVVLVAVQLSVLGLYLPPLFVTRGKLSVCPAQTIISVPVQTAVWTYLASGALIVLVGVQLSVAASYRPPVLTKPASLKPPHTIISTPVEIAV